MGVEFRDAGMVRQAVQQLERANALAPDGLLPRLLLCKSIPRSRMPATRRSNMISGIRSNAAFQPLGSDQEVELASPGSPSLVCQDQPLQSRRIIDSLAAAHPGDAGVLDLAVDSHRAPGLLPTRFTSSAGSYSSLPKTSPAWFTKAGSAP